MLIRSDQIGTIRTHAEQAYPQECCGLLLGWSGGQSPVRGDRGSKTLVEVYPAENAWISESAEATEDDRFDKTRRYSIDPKDMLKGQRYARDAGLEIIGIYHSHPDHPAVPSECDRLNAWTEYLYLIVSVDRGIAQDLLCWKLDDRHQFQPQALRVAVS